MRKKLLCLTLALLMIVPICLMAGCGLNFGGESTDTTGSATSEADQTTETLTMFLITERHVPTAAELDKIKTEKGGDSAEYREAYNVRQSYQRVAAEIDKITKAKFRTHLVVSFYTEEEYEVVEKLMEYQAREKLIRTEAKDKLKAYTKRMKAFGIKDTAQIREMFYKDYPQYASYSEAIIDPDDTVVTEAETIKNEYGIAELKYPDALPNQVDIICVCGYDNYQRYIKNGWLAELDEELSGTSKAILTYVNDKFMDAAKSGDATYGVPNNKAIGNYKYLLINKELFDFYQYNIQSISSVSDDYVLDFLNELQQQNEAMKEDPTYTPVLPFVAKEEDLTEANVLYWALNYEYTAVENFESYDSSKTYYHRDEYGEYHRIYLKPDETISYYKPKATEAKNLTEFKSGVKYYTKDSYGFYHEETEFKAGTKYYTISGYTEVKKLKEFDKNTVYFLKSGSAYTQIITDRKVLNRFTVESASLDRDSFSILGTSLPKAADEGQRVPVRTITSSADFTSQNVRFLDLKSSGLYTEGDIEALHKEGKQVGMAILNGGKDLEVTLGKDYYMVVLEYPKAYATEVCENLFAVSSSSVDLARSMKIITYLTTNPAFRNLIQYGVAGYDYNTSTTVVGGRTYTTISRLNDYYRMDINKTGNTFIAYPEEDMIYNIWDYGKQQNRDAKYDVLMGFDVNEYVQTIDFSLYDRVKYYTEIYEPKFAACKTSEELKEVISEANLALNSDPLIRMATDEGNEFGLFYNYFIWYEGMGYVVD